jgi:hypothetical protein
LRIRPPLLAAALVGPCALAACATSTGVLVDHSFALNAALDSPDVEVIDYRYGNSRQPGASNDHPQRAQGKSAQATGVTGPMLVADDLYVKWRIKATGTVHEDTVDLSRRLPRDINGQKVYFFIRGSQLYVYVITNERRAQRTPGIGSRVWDHLKAIQIYPDRTSAQPERIPALGMPLSVFKPQAGPLTRLVDEGEM